jgi:hypothetical protein
VQISVKPENINPDDLTALATTLKRLFCKDDRVTVVIFDEERYAKNFSPVEENPYYKRGLESMRGEFFFDRTTNEAFVEFSTTPNYFKSKQNRKRIELGKAPVH